MISDRALSRLVVFRNITRVIFVVIVLAILLGTFSSFGRFEERALFVFPNGDVFGPGETHELHATYYIRNFAKDPDALSASGSGTVRVRVTVIQFGLQGRQNIFTGRWTYRFQGEHHHSEEWEVIIERNKVKDIRVLRPPKKQANGSV